MRRYKEARVLWLLFDISNGDDGYPTGYVWWFRTYRAAVEHKEQQAKEKYGAPLAGPYKYMRTGSVGHEPRIRR